MNAPDVPNPIQNPAQKLAEKAIPHAANPGWAYGGYSLEASSFVTALVHLYRGEITRANAWRNRLDVTTNWAVISTGAAISFAFGQPTTHHSVIILIMVLVTLFLFIEARRYRYYELWSYRIRLIETNLFAAMLKPPAHSNPAWAKPLSDSLLRPSFPITVWEAFGRRLRRNYAWMYLILGIAWLAKLLYYPTGANTISEVFERSAMGLVHGSVVVLGVVAFYVLLVAIALYTHRFQQATGEVLSTKVDDIENLASSIEKVED